MKVGIFFSLATFHCLMAFAQRYDTLEVGMMTTVHLVFESTVLEYDIGSGTRIETVNGQEHEVTDALVTKVGDRLKLAAAIADFETTNIFVETETAYFNFILKFAPRPKKLSHYFADGDADRIKSANATQTKMKAVSDAQLQADKQAQILELTLKDLSEKVANEPNQVIEIGQESQRMKYFLNGVYVKGNFLFFRVNIANEGNVKFDLGYEGFFIKDKPNRGLKKTTKQIPTPLKVFIIYNNQIKTIERNQEVKKVYVFEKFTLEPKKIFTIEFWEDAQGQRKVELNISPNDILSAKTIE
jgi:hypothetical protein